MIMAVLDFYNTHSNYKLAQNYSNIAYFRNYQRISVPIGTNAKLQMTYGNAHDSWCIVFLNRFQLVIVHASFFHYALYLIAKIAFYAVGKLKICNYMYGILYPP